MDGFDAKFGLEAPVAPVWYTCLIITAVVLGLFCLLYAYFPTYFKTKPNSKPIKRVLSILLLLSIVGISADKPITKERLFRLLYFPWYSPWALQSQANDLKETASYLEHTESVLDAADTILGTNDVCYVSFDWAVPNRQPNISGRQNVMGWTVWVNPTNINGNAYEDHYVAFSAQAADQPSILMIEYAQTQDDGTILRYTSDVATNSYPDTVTLVMDSGEYECYWFRCEVPPPFVSQPRDWNGELLFGSPIGSGRGFDLSGIIVVDDGNDVWVGDSGIKTMSGIDYVFTNGICIGVSP